MNITLQAMQPTVHGVNIVSKVEDVHLHIRLFLKESARNWSRLRLSSARRIPSDNLQVQAHGVLGCDTGTREGHECLCSSLLYRMAARIGMETIVVEVR